MSEEQLNRTVGNEDLPLAVNSTILGAAAEHYVMYQLLRMGKIAALAPAGVPNADIIVTDQLGSMLVAIQVKARREAGRDGGWHMKAKHEGMKERLLFYCFVDFGRSRKELPRCWVLPSIKVAETLRVCHLAWLAQPGRGGRRRKDSDMRRLLPNYPEMKGHRDFSTGWLNPYFENWDFLEVPTVA